MPIPDSPSSDSRRGAVLRAALGFLALEPRAPELQLLHRCFDSWRGVGDVVVRMERQGYRLHLTNIEPGTWRATFSHDAMSAAEGFAAAPTPWTAVRRSARQARYRHRVADVFAVEDQLGEGGRVARDPVLRDAQFAVRPLKSE